MTRNEESLKYCFCCCYIKWNRVLSENSNRPRKKMSTRM